MNDDLLGNSRNLLHLLVISLYLVFDLSLFPHGGESDVVEEVDEVGGEPARPEYHHHRNAKPEKNTMKSMYRVTEVLYRVR